MKKPALNESKILITGSSGFVGPHFVDKCFSLGYEVFPVDIKEGFDMTGWNQVRMYDHEIEIHSRNRERKNEIFETRADISKATKLLNWKPAVSLVEGLRLMIRV